MNGKPYYLELPSSEPPGESSTVSQDPQNIPNQCQQVLASHSDQEVSPNHKNQNPIGGSTRNSASGDKNGIIIPSIHDMLQEEEDMEIYIQKKQQAILETVAESSIRKVLVFCLTQALGLRSLEFLFDPEGFSFRTVFLLCYTFLIYLLVEYIIKVKTLKDIRWERMENLCMAIDIAVLILVTLIGDLKLNGYNLPVKPILIPLMGNFLFYIYKSEAPTTAKFRNLTLRLCYVLQILILVLNLTGDLDWSWEATILLIWPMSVSIQLISIMSVFVALSTGGFTIYCYFKLDSTTTSKYFAITILYSWFTLCSSPGAVLSIGLFSVRGEQWIRNCLVGYFILARNLNIFACVYTLLIYIKLKKSLVAGYTFEGTYLEELGEEFGSGVPLIRSQQIKVDLVRLSSTYYTSTTNTIEAQKNEVDNLADDQSSQLCYICYEKASNAVMAQCGHGGICVDCAIETVKTRKECMECRQRVQAIIKIDINSRRGNIVKAVEAITIKR